MTKIITEKIKVAPSIDAEFNRVLSEDTFDSGATLISFVNPYSYMLLRKRKEVTIAVDYFYSDALVSCWIFSLLSFRKVPRISFDYGSFAKRFLETLNITGEPVFFIGAKEGEIEETVRLFKSSYPNLNIAGYRHGYFNSDKEREFVAQKIAASGSKFVVCGMGTPHQEKFGQLLKGTKGSIRQIYTCGGFLHQSSENIQYYPNWVNRFNLRWAYRAIKEHYVFKRLIMQYPQFLFFSLYDYLNNQKNN